MIHPGTVFQIKGVGFHAWVVISKPLNGKVLAVNFTDVKNSPDSPCKIGIGEHPIINKPSAVYYKKAREFDVDLLNHHLNNSKELGQLEDCSRPLLERIIQGAKESDELTLRFLAYLST